MLKIKSQPRSGETLMIFMPPEGPGPGGSPSVSCKVSRKPLESSLSHVKRPCCRLRDRAGTAGAPKALTVLRMRPFSAGSAVGLEFRRTH